MTIDLQPASGPACTRCGCRDAEILRHPSSTVEASWFARMGGGGLARCNHCRNVFSFHARPVERQQADDSEDGETDDDDALDTDPVRDAAYPVRQCPECGSPDTRVTSSGKKPANGSPRIRYHQCLACQINFKSIDSRHLR